MSTISQDVLSALPELVKAVFSQPADKAADSKITVRPLRIKGRIVYQAERFRDNRAYHENMDEESLLRFVEREIDGQYRQVLIATTSENVQYVLKNNGTYRRSGKAAVQRPGGVQSHDRSKEYILGEGENIPALVDLGVFTPDFRVVRSKYDKYKQINRFVELIDDEFRRMERDEITILDFGCGKSYLTFILYYYFTVKKGVKATIIGYDLKADVVEHCNAIAKKFGYEDLRFSVADVTKDALYGEHVDMLVTLHACDVATDYALDYAIKHGVKYIFSVPCCQHEVNNQIRKGGELDILLRHGIIKERMSALLTDSIRACVLEDMGYNVDMIEFIDFEHSPKNIMIRASAGRKSGTENIEKARALAEKYGFKQTLLELCN